METKKKVVFKIQEVLKNKKLLYIIGGVLLALIAAAVLLFFFLKKEKTYAITFDTDGGSAVEQVVVKEGESVILPTEPTKEGFRFNGWLLDGKPFAPSTKITKDVKLVASWIAEDAVTFKVTFTPDNGNPAIEVEVVENTGVVKPTDPTKDNSTFKGWFLNDVEYDFGQLVTGDITLVAKWEEVKAEEKKETPKKEMPKTETPKVVDATGVSLDKSALTLRKGTSGTLTATVSPTNATNKAVTWTSSNPGIATVSNGTVTAVAKGTTTIIATTANGKVATATVTVTNPVVSVALTYNRNAIAKKGVTSASVKSIVVTPSDADGKGDIKYFGSYPDGPSGCLGLNNTNGIVSTGATERQNCSGTFWVTAGGVKSNVVTIIGETSLQVDGLDNWNISMSPNSTKLVNFGYTTATFSYGSPTYSNFFTFSPASGKSTTITTKGSTTGMGSPVYLSVKTAGGQSESLAIQIN